MHAHKFFFSMRVHNFFNLVANSDTPKYTIQSMQTLPLWVLLCEQPMGGFVSSKTSLCHSHVCTQEDWMEHHLA